MSGIKEILIGPSRRWREDALKNLPYMGQKVRNRPLARKLRAKIARVKSRRRLFGDVAGLRPPTSSRKGFAIEALLSPVYRVREVLTSVGLPQEIVIDRAY